MVRLLIVDDHAIVRQGLERLFATAPDIEVVDAVGDGNAALHAVARHRPDVILMDISMPVLGGVGATRLIADHDRNARIIVLTGSPDGRVAEALAAGAHACLLKDVEPAELIDAVRSAARPARPAPPPVGGGMSLTDREVEALTHLAEGLGNREIAARMGIAERTIKSHLSSAYRVIGVQDRVGAALWGRRNLLRSRS